jgi:hypothetical protein
MLRGVYIGLNYRSGVLKTLEIAHNRARIDPFKTGIDPPPQGINHPSQKLARVLFRVHFFIPLTQT